jgi:hypothetical protein
VLISGGSDSCIATLSAGGGQCILSDGLPAGTQTLTGTYSGDANHASVTDTADIGVAQAATATLLSGPASSTQGSSTLFTYDVSAVAPGAGAPSGAVTIAYTGAASGTLCNATVASGGCSSVLPAPGVYTLTASYGGDANFTDSSSAGLSHTVQISNAPNSIFQDQFENQ